MSSTAPRNGPSSSLALSQDRLALEQSIEALYASINNLGGVLDPGTTSIPTPLLPASLSVALPAGSIMLGNVPCQIAGVSLALPPFSDTYVTISVTGEGLEDFPASSFSYQDAGQYAGSALILPSILQATSPLSFLHQRQCWTNYYANTTNGAGGWGPALLDGSGNGYQVRSSAGAGGIYRVTGNALDAQLCTLGNNTANLTGGHQFALVVSYLNPGFEVKAYIDNMVSPIADYVDLSPVVSPASLFPAFISDGMLVYLTSSSWYNEGGIPTAGWTATSVPAGAPSPVLDVDRDNVPMFIVTTSTIPLAIRSLFGQYTISNRIAALRDTLNLLKDAYL